MKEKDVLIDIKKDKFFAYLIMILKEFQTHMCKGLRT